MRVVRTAMLSATLATLALGAQLAACGGDDENHAGPPGDPTPDAEAPSDAGASPTGPTLTISSSRAKLYLGQTAKIDGATIAPEIVSKLAWTVVAAPSRGQRRPLRRSSRTVWARTRCRSAARRRMARWPRSS